LLKEAAIVCLHELIPTLKLIVDPTGHVGQSIRRYAPVVAKAVVLEALYDHL
jgi:hypothetical protein